MRPFLATIEVYTSRMGIALSAGTSPKKDWPHSSVVLLVVFLLFAVGQGHAQQANDVDAVVIEAYVREGCPHCDAAKVFLAKLESEQPVLRVELIDVRRDAAGLTRLQELARTFGLLQIGVPTFHVDGYLIVGFENAETTGVQIRTRVTEALAVREPSLRSGHAQPPSSPSGEKFTISFLDRRVSVDELGLPLFTIVIGLVDGFNPCSMWVLILMLSMLASMADRRRMLLVAGVFVAVEGLVYFAFMAAWLNLFLLLGLSRVSEVVIGLLAIVAGVINVKDFVAFGRGFTLSIPQAAKPGIYARLRAILSAERLWPALVGTAILAFLVQVVELLCTSGLPALYTRLLTTEQLDVASYYAYLLLYIVIYMLDDIVVLVIGVTTMSQQRLQEREGRLLKLVAGVVMLVLGGYLLLPARV